MKCGHDSTPMTDARRLNTLECTPRPAHTACGSSKREIGWCCNPLMLRRLEVGSSGWTPMRPVVVKAPGFSQCSGTPPSGPRNNPQERGHAAANSTTSTIGTRRWFNRDHQALAASCCRSGMAPTLLLSVSVPCTEHQNLMGEAWERAPLLELGVTSVNPSSRRALAPARWSPTRDRSVVPSDLHRFQLRAVWDDTGLQIPPQRD